MGHQSARQAFTAALDTLVGQVQQDRTHSGRPSVRQPVSRYGLGEVRHRPGARDDRRRQAGGRRYRAVRGRRQRARDPDSARRVPPDGRGIGPELVHALAARQGPAALHPRRDHRPVVRRAASSSAHATRRSSSCAPPPERSRPSTRRTSGSSRAATSTTPRSGSCTRQRRWPQVEVIGAGRVADREVIPQAMTLNPALFETIYTGLLNTKKSRENVVAALEAVDRYLAARAPVALRAGRRLPARGRRSAFVRGDREPLHAPLRRQRGDDGVRVPGGSGVDRQGVGSGAADQEEQRPTCRSWRSCTWATRGRRLSEPVRARPSR